MDSFNIMGIGACIAVVLMGLCWIIRLIANIDKENPSKEDNKAKNSKEDNKAEKKKMLKLLKSGDHTSALEQDGICYKPYFDKEKGLYIPMVVVDISSRSNPFGLIQKNVIYYQLIPLSVLSDIRNHFEEEITQALLKNNKGNNNKENNEQGE